LKDVRLVGLPKPPRRIRWFDVTTSSDGKTVVNITHEGYGSVKDLNDFER